MKYQENKGKICNVPECNNIARVKGLCMGCYLKNRKRKRKANDHPAIVRIDVVKL